MSLRRLAPTALVLALAMAACGEPGVTLEELESFSQSPRSSASVPPYASVTPSARPGASETAMSSASPTASVGAGLEVDGLAEVIVTDLVVRSAPGVDPATSTILADRLGSGDRAFVVDGPVDASGYAWYLVAPLLRADDSAGPFGWIAAASREGDAWVRLIEPPCPTAVNLAGVLALQPLERLACLGDETLTLGANAVSCGIGDGPWEWEPAWLGSIGGCALADGDLALLVRVAPGDEQLNPTAESLTVRGHFDDPASASCRVISHDPSYPAPSLEHAILMCRTEFVMEG